MDCFAVANEAHNGADAVIARNERRDNLSCVFMMPESYHNRGTVEVIPVTFIYTHF